jgi:hypothetical protein
MIAGLASLIITLGVIILVIRRIAVGRRGGTDFAEEVKDFFQYVLLLVLVIIVNTGMSGLISYALGSDKRLLANEDLLARDSAFVVVATPLLIAVSIWTRRTLERDLESRESFALLLYLSAIQVVAFASFATSTYGYLLEFAEDRTLLGQDLGRAVLWLITLIFHYRMTKNRLTPLRAQLPFLLISGISLVVSIVATARIIRALMVEFLPFSETLLTTAGPNEISRGLILAVIAAPTWFFYWLINQSHAKPTQLWNIYLLIIGVGASLVAALVSASIVFYDVLVWFFGDTSTDAAWIHFDGVPSAIGALVGTLASFSYHSRVLQSHHDAEEGEIGRIYRYLLAAIGLVTAAVGAVTLVVSIVESFIEENLIVGRSPQNALLLGLTLLAVGLPVWLAMWRKITQLVATDAAHELGSISRKVYLFTIVGVSSIAAVASILTITVQIFQGIFGGDLGGSSLREMSYAISILIVGIVAGTLHLQIIRHERSQAGPREKTHKFLLLIGPADKGLARELERSTGARIEFLESLDGLATEWDREKIASLLESNKESEIALIADSGQIRAIPIKR